MYPCFIALINMGTSSGAYELNHEGAITRTRTSTHILIPR